MKKLSVETLEQITKYLREQIPNNITEGDIDKIEKLNYGRGDVIRLAQKYNVTDPDGLADNIDRMKEKTAITRNWGRKPWVPGRILTVSFVSALVTVVVILLVQSCSGRTSNDGSAVLDPNAATLKDVVDLKGDIAEIKKDMLKKSDVAAIMTFVSEQGTKLDGLVASVNQLTVSTTALTETTNMLVESSAKLATTKHLRRVERKVDRLLIANEADEDDEEPVAEVKKEPAPPGNGTIHVVIRRIPVDDDE